MTATDPCSNFAERRRERNQLVEAHSFVVEHFVRRYAHRGVAEDDLRQTAFLALVEAADRFDPTLGVKFATFASRTIDGTLKRYFRDRTWTVRPPRRLQELHLQVRRANEELTHGLGRHPTIDELSAHLDVDIDDIHQALEASSAHAGVSMDASRPGVDDTDMGDPAWMGETDDGYDLAEARALVESILEDLDPDQRELLELRFVDGLSQTEMAERYGITQSYLSRKVRRLCADIGAIQGDLEAV